MSDTKYTVIINSKTFNFPTALSHQNAFIFNPQLLIKLTIHSF